MLFQILHEKVLKSDAEFLFSRAKYWEELHAKGDEYTKALLSKLPEAGRSIVLQQHRHKWKQQREELSAELASAKALVEEYSGPWSPQEYICMKESESLLQWRLWLSELFSANLRRAEVEAAQAVFHMIDGDPRFLYDDDWSCVFLYLFLDAFLAYQ